MTKQQVMMPTFIVYGVAIIGSVYGGSIPMTLIKKGMAVYKARMLAMFLIALAPLAVLFTQYFGNVGRFGKMAASAGRRDDLHRRRRASGVVGKSFHDRFRHVPEKNRRLGHGHWRHGRRPRRRDCPAARRRLTDAFKTTPQTAYLIMFIVCALSYLIAWGVMKALVPRHQPITDL